MKEIKNDNDALEVLLDLYVIPFQLLTTGEKFEMKYELEEYIKNKKMIR